MVRVIYYETRVDIPIGEWPTEGDEAENLNRPCIDGIKGCIEKFRALRDGARDTGKAYDYGKCALLLNFAAESGAELSVFATSPPNITFLFKFDRLEDLNEFNKGVKNFNKNLGF